MEYFSFSAIQIIIEAFQCADSTFLVLFVSCSPLDVTAILINPSYNYNKWISYKNSHLTVGSKTQPLTQAAANAPARNVKHS